MNDNHLKQVIIDLKCNITNIRNEILEKRIRLDEAIAQLNKKKDDLEILLEKLEFILSENEKEG